MVLKAIFANNQDAQVGESVKLHHMRHIKSLGREYTRKLVPSASNEVVVGSPLNDFIEKRKVYRLKDLSLPQRLDIAHEVIVELK